jgi:2-polyprenyl-3-methyl-5-hydroxy-6-metoxy-1,4-benzoquinol methylase
LRRLEGFRKGAEADLQRGDDYFEKIRSLLEHSYLTAEDPRGQSGFRGNEARWERARGPIVSAIDRDATFLDVGCANGLLMQSLAIWAAEEGHRVKPYGLDLIEPLAALARRRLPEWADHIFKGNVTDRRPRRPPRRFDFVRTELEYAPPERSRELVECLLREYLSPGGRLIICS